MQIFWDDEIQEFKAEGKAVDVIPLGTPMLARISCVSCNYDGETSYKATRNAVPFDRINEAFNAYLGENPYATLIEGVRPGWMQQSWMQTPLCWKKQNISA